MARDEEIRDLYVKLDEATNFVNDAYKYGLDRDNAIVRLNEAKIAIEACLNWIITHPDSVEWAED